MPIPIPLFDSQDEQDDWFWELSELSDFLRTHGLKIVVFKKGEGECFDVVDQNAPDDRGRCSDPDPIVILRTRHH